MNYGLVLLVIVIVVGLGTLLLGSIRVIGQCRVGIVERHGKFRRTLDPGVHLLVPIFEQLRNTIDMRATVLPVAARAVLTADQWAVDADAVIQVQVTDPVRASYEVHDYRNATEQMATIALKNLLAKRDHDRTPSSKDEIERELLYTLELGTRSWGLMVGRVEIRSVLPSSGRQG